MAPVDPTIEGNVISKTYEPLTDWDIAAFNKATLSSHVQGMHPVFPTRYRDTEFMWLEDTKVDMRQLLHTDQEYEYIAPLKVGDRPRAETRIIDMRQKRNLHFYTLETLILCGNDLKIRGRATFVIRTEEKK